MPVISVSGPKLNAEQKKSLISEFTETASRVMNIPKESFVVLIQENPQENVGVGGVPLTERHKGQSQ
jgi:4-oxalocrotonate tautomerase